MKPAEFIASALDDISAMPDEVKEVFGFAIYMAQRGEKHQDAKPLKGFGGAGVLEVVENYDGDTYRAVYTVKFAGMVYVLDVFQKKSKQGSRTAKARYRAHQVAAEISRTRLCETETARKDSLITLDGQSNVMTHRKTTSNVFKDIGLPNAEEHALKADLVIKLAKLIELKGLTQSKAADLTGIAQPDLSKLLRGHIAGFSMDRLLQAILDLGSDVEIRVKKPAVNRRGRAHVLAA